MACVWDPDQIGSKHKGAIALFPYAVQRERCGEGGMIDAFFGVVRASKLGSFDIGPLVTALFDEGSPGYLNRVITLASPYALWNPQDSHSGMVTRWVAAVSVAPDTEEVGQSVVDALLQIASLNSLQPHIPVDVWALLKKRPSLPPVCLGRSRGTAECVVRRVREIGDLGILKSYLLLVWSEWDGIHPDGLVDMRASIRQDFGGVGMRGHRQDLIERLDHILGELDRRSGYLKHRELRIGEDPQQVRRQYEGLKEVLLEVDEKALVILTRTPSRSTNIFDSLTSAGICRVPLDVCMCPTASVPIVACLRYSWSPQLHVGSPPGHSFMTPPSS